jgi:uncharacterized membrane protein
MLHLITGVEAFKPFTNAVAGAVLYPTVFMSCYFSWSIALFIAAGSAVGSLGLGFLLLTKLGEFCPVCFSIYVCNFVLLYLINSKSSAAAAKAKRN